MKNYVFINLLQEATQVPSLMGLRILFMFFEAAARNHFFGW